MSSIYDDQLQVYFLGTQNFYQNNINNVTQNDSFKNIQDRYVCIEAS